MRRLLLQLRDLVRSISSLPTLVFLLFVALGIIQVSTTDGDATLPGWLERFNISDLDTIRALLAAIIGGVFTLTIFAYTMVMNVIDRSIGSYSPRLLPLILAERYHQLILGVGAGTIAHSIILFLGVTEPPDNARPPSWRRPAPVCSRWRAWSCSSTSSTASPAAFTSTWCCISLIATPTSDYRN